MLSAPQLEKTLKQLTGVLNSLLERTTQIEAQLGKVYDQGANLVNSFESLSNSVQAEAIVNKNQHDVTTCQLGGLRTDVSSLQASFAILKRTLIDFRRSDNLRREADYEADNLRRKADHEAENQQREAEHRLREEEHRQRDEQELADLDDRAEQERADLKTRNVENGHRQHLMRGLEHLMRGLDQDREAAKVAASSAARAAEARNAMLGGARAGVALEQGTPVKGTPVKSPARGQGTPLSTRGMSASSIPVPKAPPGRAKPEQRPAAACGQSTSAAKPRTPIATRGQRNPACRQSTPAPGVRAPLPARVKSGAASTAKNPSAGL